MTVLGLTRYLEMACINAECDDCGHTWFAEVCTDLGAHDFVYPEEQFCSTCGQPGGDA